ncbi:MAG: sigma-70 family RNA polymerase sigma factor [Akkermansia sp.]|nr:sigma-70 family RNA polymerase sigma factor [Akkermansia sp.]
MADDKAQGVDTLAAAWLENRARLLRLVNLQMSDELRRRMTADDMLQEAYLHCCRNAEYFARHTEVPVYAKLRTMTMQAIASAGRRLVLAARRDVRQEVSPEANIDAWANFADTLTSPLSHLIRQERRSIVRKMLAQLSPSDRDIIAMRHFEELGNNECAALLQISPAAASVRYVRALKRMTALLDGTTLG